MVRDHDEDECDDGSKMDGSVGVHDDDKSSWTEGEEPGGSVGSGGDGEVRIGDGRRGDEGLGLDQGSSKSSGNMDLCPDPIRPTVAGAGRIEPDGELGEWGRPGDGSPSRSLPPDSHMLAPPETARCLGCSCNSPSCLPLEFGPSPPIRSFVAPSYTSCTTENAAVALEDNWAHIDFIPTAVDLRMGEVGFGGESVPCTSDGRNENADVFAEYGRKLSGRSARGDEGRDVVGGDGVISVGAGVDESPAGKGTLGGEADPRESTIGSSSDPSTGPITLAPG